MTTDVSTFSFDGAVVRALQIDGQPWFVAADVCATLDIANPRDALTRLDDDEKGVASTDTLGGRQQTAIVNESGLYVLILGSRKPEAKRFKRWVTHDVLPQIRKTGSYQAPAVPQTLAQALRLAADQAEQIEQQAQALALAAPKVAFVDRYVEADTGMKGFRQVTKLLKANEARFREFLIDNKIMYRLGGEWMAHQQHIDAGRFEVRTGEAHGHAFNRCLFTPKGTEWIAAQWAVHNVRAEVD